MLIPGHQELLRAAMRLADALEREEGDTGGHQAAASRLLRLPARRRLSPAPAGAAYAALAAGMRYPDLPCAHRRLDPRTGAVSMVDRHECQLVRLAELLRSGTKPGGRRGEVYSEAFVSHKLGLSHWHAMSGDPHHTVRQVRSAVLRFACACALRAAHPGSPHAWRMFWLGRLLHVVQDAYSPAHTVRVAVVPPGVDMSQLVRALTALSRAHLVSPRPSDLSSEVIVSAIGRAAQRAAHGAPSGLKTGLDVLRAVSDELHLVGVSQSQYPAAASRHLRLTRIERHTVNLFLAFMDEERAAMEAEACLALPPGPKTAAARAKVVQLAAPSQRAPDAAAPATPAKQRALRLLLNHGRDGPDGGGQDGDPAPRSGRPTVAPIDACALITFNCYASQQPLQHAVQDTLSFAQGEGLRAHAVWESAAVLRMYSRCTVLQEEQRAQGASAAAAATAACRTFVEGVRALMLRRVLRLHSPACQNFLTGFDVADIVKELIQ